MDAGKLYFCQLLMCNGSRLNKHIDIYGIPMSKYIDIYVLDKTIEPYYNFIKVSRIILMLLYELSLLSRECNMLSV